MSKKSLANIWFTKAAFQNSYLGQSLHWMCYCLVAVQCRAKLAPLKPHHPLTFVNTDWIELNVGNVWHASLEKNHVLIVIQDLRWWHALALPSALLSLWSASLMLYTKISSTCVIAMFHSSLLQRFLFWDSHTLQMNTLLFSFLFSNTNHFNRNIIFTSIKLLLNAKRLITMN